MRALHGFAIALAAAGCLRSYEVRPLLERREVGEDFIYASARERDGHPGRFHYEVPAEQFGPLPRAMIEARLRLELTDTDFGDPTAALTRLRLRVDSGRARESLNYLFELQDSRAVMTSGGETESGGLDLRQAYLFIALPRSVWGVKLGRQEIDLGTGRMFGSNWHDQIDPGHDGARLTLANRWGYFEPRQNAWQFDLFAARSAAEGDRTNLAGAYYSDWRRYPFRLDGGLLVSASDDDSVGTASAAAVGEGFGRARGFELDAEAALQFGSVDGARHRASLLACRLGYVFPTPWRVRVEAGAERASGDASPTEGTSRTFRPPGPGDLRSRLGMLELIGLSNSIVHTLAAGFEPVEDLRLTFAARWLRLDEVGGGWIGADGEPVPVTPGEASLGVETSLSGTYTFITERGKEVRLEGGYAMFEPSGSLPVDAIQKLYLQAALRF